MVYPRSYPRRLVSLLMEPTREFSIPTPGVKGIVLVPTSVSEAVDSRTE
jgi:hypothetical protein